MATLDFLIIGAGPAGLQLGYYLERAGANYQILEASSVAGSFFRTYPRHRKLISINKVHTGYDDAEINMRWDWNSLLSDEHEPLFRDYSREYFPQADRLVEYLGDFARRYKLNIKYDTTVQRIRRNGRFQVTDECGATYDARVLIVATGLATPYVPDIEGIEHAENYTEISMDAEDFAAQRVLILGKGNSAFETADHIVGTASLIHLASPESVKFAWKTHHVGHLRAVNNNLLDTYLLKSQNALLDSEVSYIRQQDDGLHVGFAYAHADGEEEELVYDRVICCTGFRCDVSMFDSSCSPELMIEDRLPSQTSHWESTNVEDLYFAGALMQARDFKKKQSAFIHGYRYNINFLSRLLLHKYLGRDLEFTPLDACPKAVAHKIIDRVNRDSAMWQQNGFLCDLIVVPQASEPLEYYTGLPLDYVDDTWGTWCEEYYTLTMEFGQERIDAAKDVFSVDRPHKDDIVRAADSSGIHPIIRRYRRGELLSVHHVIEDLKSEWLQAKHLDPLVEYFRKQWTVVKAEAS